ncbi:unnamed protein product [Fusarium fujikuroi]|uniref:Uncharacterized protein n=1 Tax=Fusarium fujikuroi TaxID=5127 RepID=A0A9Q9RIA5_FUSFU|nr:hypothetical protein CEK25_000136 [Fusarium fujikuroi]VTT62304.1 unnamed protein product [Fusarium fujikuroi]VZH90707.1 unnamed protein product [Fusarium fujikuroi]
MLEAEHYRPKMQLFYTIHSDDPNLIGKEETFLGPDNQSKMKRSVENAEHVGKQLLTINRNDRQLTLVDLGLFTPTAGQYFRDERRRRHSQYYGGLAQGSTLSATASSFEPLGQRFKGKNALVFYPEGGGAPSQDMDISHRIEVCDTPAPSIAELGNYITAWTMFRIDLPTLRITFLNTFPDILGDWPPQEGRPYEPPRFRSTWADVMSEPPSCFETSRTRTANLLRRKLLAPLSGGPIACFDSGWPELFGDFVVSRSDPSRKAGECRPWFSGPPRGAPGAGPARGTEHRIERSMDVMVAARRSMYGADMLPRTTNFGVTPEEARELNKKQHGSVLKLWLHDVVTVPLGGTILCNRRGGRAYHLFFSNTTNFGVTPEEARELHQSQKAYDGAKATAAPDGGGIWDGGASKDDPSNLI